MVGPSLSSGLAEAQVLPHPALRKRTALRERRPQTVRRHSGRVATRFAVLVTGDLTAILIARAIALWATEASMNAALAYSQTPLVGGGPRFVFLALLTLAAI